jgi:hypothetical protein
MLEEIVVNLKVFKGKREVKVDRVTYEPQYFEKSGNKVQYLDIDIFLENKNKNISDK